MNRIYLFVIVLMMFTIELYGQRSPYAGRRPTGPRNNLDQFSTTVATGTTATTSGVTTTTTNINSVNELNNRLNINGGNNVNGNPVPVGPTTATIITTTARIPYDALGDIEGYNFASKLPDNQKPFWLLNHDAIEAHRNGGVVAPQNSISNQFENQLANRFGPDNLYSSEVHSPYDIVYPISIKNIPATN